MTEKQKCTSSTPVLGTKKKSSNNKGFANSEPLVSKSATVIAKLKDMLATKENNKFDLAPNGIPIHPVEPQLKIPAPTSKDQRLYIKFYVWDELLKKHVVFKDYEINNKKETDRDAFAQKRIAELKADLRLGFHRNRLKSAEIKQEVKTDVKLIEKVTRAFELVITQKRVYRPKTHKNYQYHVGHFVTWINENHKKMICPELDKDICKRFFEYLSDKRLGRRSINNFKSYLTTAWYDLQKDGYFGDNAKNPFSSIPKLATGLGKNISFREEQQREILDFLRAKNKTRQRLLSLFMYYTLLRTNELAQLQIHEIEGYRKGFIYLPKEKSKNNHERFIKIGPDLRQVLNEMELTEYPKNYYVWGKYLLPNIECYGSSKIGDLYGRTVLRPLKYSVDTYSLYSWKHTGVVAAKRAGVPDADIMIQGGWLDVRSYNTYLKSLGMYAETNYDSLVPSIISY